MNSSIQVKSSCSGTINLHAKFLRRLNSGFGSASSRLRSFAVPSGSRKLLLILLIAVACVNQSLFAATASDIAHQTATTVENAEKAATDTAKDLWQRIDAARLKNRTPDQLVAWGIMGLLAGAFAGMMTKLNPSGMGAFGRLVLGLAGAFLGGIAVAAFNVNFGWGPVLIRYEELVFSLVGAIVILILWKLISSGMKKKAAH